MESRGNKVTTRQSKNQDLYRDLYKNTTYSNMVVIDDSNEIDINKIKKIIDKEKRPTREVNNNYMYDSLNEYYKLDEKKEEKRNFDINQVLKEAKSKRNIIEEANEKRKIENYKFKNNLDLETELAKTRKVYNDLVKEETELLNIMNTLTNIDINSNKQLSETTSMALDLLEDMKEENQRKDKIIQKKDELLNNTITETLGKTIRRPAVKQINQSDNDTQEYSTDTFMFETRDFDGLNNVKDQLGKSSIFTKIIIFIFTVIVVIVCYFVVTKYLLK